MAYTLLHEAYVSVTYVYAVCVLGHKEKMCLFKKCESSYHSVLTSSSLKQPKATLIHTYQGSLKSNVLLKTKVVLDVRPNIK